MQHTANEKTFGGADLRIDFAAGRPNPEDLRQEFLSAAALLPSLSTNIPADQATLYKAIAIVDFKALDAHDQGRFDASLKAAAATLVSLKPVLQQGTFFETGNSHIDAAWLWPCLLYTSRCV